MVLSACSSQQPVIVTVTTTPGVGQVTIPSAVQPSTSAQGGGARKASRTASVTTKSTGPTAPATRVSANPAFGTKNIGPNEPITVTVFNAELEKVAVLGDDGSAIAGKIAADKHTWTRTERLKYGVTYTLTATAVASDGAQQPIEGTFSTVKPKTTMAAYIQIPNGATVGIAAPIIVTFAGAVKDRAAAEKALTVTVDDGKKIEGSWGWMQDEDIQGNGVKQSRVHFRPKDFWPAHTKVHVQANLYGVNYGSAWGREDIVRNFQIGDDLKVKADVDSHRLLVIKDDNVIRNYPVSYGVPASVDGGRTTVSGIHVITDKKPGEFTMCNPKYGYCGVKEYWGVRMNNNGEFIHVNKETEAAGLLGKENVSHGCVNMSMKDGKQFFNMVYYGVPVDVRNTGVKMTYSDYIWDWSVDYATWKTFSAL